MFSEQYMEQVKRITLAKLKDTSVPAITIAPQFSMDEEEWTKLMALVMQVIKKVEGKAHVPFIVDIQDVLVKEKKKHECEKSPDGYHHVFEFSNEKVDSCLMCVHCNELFVKASLEDENVKKALESKGFKFE